MELATAVEQSVSYHALVRHLDPHTAIPLSQGYQAAINTSGVSLSNYKNNQNFTLRLSDPHTSRTVLQDVYMYMYVFMSVCMYMYVAILITSLPVPIYISQHVFKSTLPNNSLFLLSGS